MPVPQQDYFYQDNTGYDALDPSVAVTVERRPSDMLHELATYTNERRDSFEPEEDGEETEMGYWRDEFEEEDELPAESFVNLSLLSNLAVQLRDKVPRNTHVKGSIPYPGAFTGKDIVARISTLII
jgi:RHO1 GDP-GTP exchange protein 1/2